jgi:hypothetical protein
MTIHGSARGPDRHPSLEAVAAFVDGRLAGEERRRMVEHLAHCDDCHELMSETVLLMRESADSTEAEDGSGTVAEDIDAPSVPGRLLRPPPGRFRRALPLVAALAAAAVVALLVWTPAGDLILRRGGATVAVDDLVATLPAADPRVGDTLQGILEDNHGWIVLLGPGPAPSEEQERAFQAGVLTSELQTALAGGDKDKARQLLYGFDRVLGEGVSPLLRYYADIRELLASAPTADLLALNVTADSLLAPDPRDDYPGYVDGTFYLLGKWAGAGQLAVAAGRLDWFDEPGPRRALRQLRRAELPADVAEPFSTITAILDAGPGEADLPRLREAFETLIRRAGGGRDPEPGPGP